MFFRMPVTTTSWSVRSVDMLAAPGVLCALATGKDASSRMAPPLAVELTIEGCRPDIDPRAFLFCFTDIPPSKNLSA
jgi:hypothetical protein